MSAFPTSKIVNISGFELRKLGCLTPIEERWFEENVDSIQRQQAQRMLATVDLYVAEGAIEAEAFEYANNAYAVPEDRQLWLIRVSENLRKQFDDEGCPLQIPGNAEVVTFFVEQRAKKSWLETAAADLNDAYGIEINEFWDSGCTDLLPVTVIDEIAQFAYNERNRWPVVETETEAELELEPTEKKSTASAPGASGKKLTGKVSTGG
jgi:hypothetical protein